MMDQTLKALSSSHSKVLPPNKPSTSLKDACFHKPVRWKIMSNPIRMHYIKPGQFWRIISAPKDTYLGGRAGVGGRLQGDAQQIFPEWLNDFSWPLVIILWDSKKKVAHLSSKNNTIQYEYYDSELCLLHSWLCHLENSTSGHGGGHGVGALESVWVPVKHASRFQMVQT